MDWRLFAATFVTIFVAELGDKTQIAAFAAGAQSKSVWPVLFATILALSIAGTIGVLAGNALGALIDPSQLKWASGVVFILMGIWIIASK